MSNLDLMAGQPLVSVIMNCWNSETYLREAIDSVYAQTYPHWEIIFWDNQSTDGSAGIAQSYDERLRYFRGDEFLPLGEARNGALGRARGEFAAILDCDDVWRPDKLEQQVALLRSKPDLSMVYSNCDIINRDGASLGPMLKESQFYRGDVFEPLLLFKFFPPWPTVMFRKTDRLQFSSYKNLEDYDVLLRVAHQSPFDYIPDCLAKYRLHAGQLFRDFETTLTEQLSICDYWSRQPELQSRVSVRLIRRARACAYLAAGTAALYRGNDAATIRSYFKESMRQALSVRALFYFLISFIGQQRASELACRVRELFGYSRNLHVKPD
jgi:glycosyltransferase involved in cell wall biosynthesis